MRAMREPRERERYGETLKKTTDKDNRETSKETPSSLREQRELRESYDSYDSYENYERELSERESSQSERESYETTRERANKPLRECFESAMHVVLRVVKLSRSSCLRECYES